MSSRLRFPFAAPNWPAGLDRPHPKRRVGLDYDHHWSRRYPVRLARAVMLDNLTRPAARLLAPATVRGAEHLGHLGAPVIFAANHASHIDTPLFLTTLPVAFRHRTVVAAASDYFFDHTWKATLWSFALAAIPIERTKVNRRSADTAADLLRAGWNLVIFPEGGRSPDGWRQPFRGGAAYLSRRTGRPVVPVYLHGTREVLAKDRAGLHRSPVTVVFGSPLRPTDDEDARRFGTRIEAAVDLLAAEVAGDWWTARRQAAGGTTAASRGPDAVPWRRSWSLGAGRPGPITRRWPG